MDGPVVLSYGGGRQTVALCILVRKGIVPRPDRIVIADTGREKRSTWDWMERYTRPLMREMGLEIEVAPLDLATVDLYAHNGDMLMPLYTKTGKLDPFCTGEWKQAVVARHLRASGITEGTKLIGFALDEGRRIRGLSTKGKWKPSFPLAELCLTKANCIRIIEDFGWAVPPPSSCWMCPNMRNSEWREIRFNRPAEFEKACQVDEELRAYDLECGGSGVWVHHSCVPLREADLQALDLKAIGGKQCSFGECFVCANPPAPLAIGRKGVRDMATQWQIKWNKAQRDRVDFGKDDLFAVGSEGRGGRWEQTGMMATDKAQFLTLFAHKLYEGLAPREAFDATERAVVEFEAKQAAKRAEKEGE